MCQAAQRVRPGGPQADDMTHGWWCRWAPRPQDRAATGVLKRALCRVRSASRLSLSPIPCPLASENGPVTFAALARTEPGPRLLTPRPWALKEEGRRKRRLPGFHRYGRPARPRRPCSGTSSPVSRVSAPRESASRRPCAAWPARWATRCPMIRISPTRDRSPMASRILWRARTRRRTGAGCSALRSRSTRWRFSRDPPCARPCWRSISTFVQKPKVPRRRDATFDERVLVDPQRVRLMAHAAGDNEADAVGEP